MAARALAPVPTRAQPGPKRVAVFSWWSDADLPTVRHLVEALAKLGHVEGRNVAIEYHWAAGDAARAALIADDLARRNVDLIIARATPAIAAAKRATALIPIVMAPSADPLATGLVASLARPGGNITGVSGRSTELGGKRLGLLRDMLPALQRAAFLGSSVDPNGRIFANELEAAGQSSGVKILSLLVAGSAEFDAAFARASAWGAAAVFVQPLFYEHGASLLTLSLQHRLPLIGTRRDMAVAGALMTYGTNQDDQMRHAARYVDRILRGAKPADLPVEEPTAFELVINLRAARALGLAVPAAILGSADEVIE